MPRQKRIIGLETEYALGFEPRGAQSLPTPTHEALFGALVRALKSRHASCEALYYKGGDFFSNGSLVHFEVARLEDPTTGLLEWATPECLGPQEAATYAKAQEHALAEAIPEAELDLAANGYDGRLYLLKNNEDRFGNAYGCHESYDVRERPPRLGTLLATWCLHPLILATIFLIGLAMALPFLALGLALLFVLGLIQAVALIPGCKRLGVILRERLYFVAEYLVEVGPTPGSGAAAHTALWFLRIGGRLFSLSAPRVLFTGHLPAFLPFLVTRPVFAGAGHLSPAGEFSLTPRSRAVRRTVAAFIFGPSRPLVDVKEFFYRRPFSYRQPRKRLHHLAGDANRSEYVELLKLATTSAVLDAIEAGALDELADRIRLRGGAVRAFRATSGDPSLQSIVAHDRRSGEALTALGVQRLYLEAVWNHFSQERVVTPETKDALVRWNFVLDHLGENPLMLDGELDWVIKRQLMSATLKEGVPELTEAEGWAQLESWGPVNALVETRSPGLTLSLTSGREEIRQALRGAVGTRRFKRLERQVIASGLLWIEYPAVREAWLRLKTIDLRYHEISQEGGYYDWWAEAQRVARVLEPERVARACQLPPERTRATIRGQLVDRFAEAPGVLRVGWERIVVQTGRGNSHTIHIRDPYQHELAEPERLAE